jgi:hypothetical protein
MEKRIVLLSLFHEEQDVDSSSPSLSALASSSPYSLFHHLEEDDNSGDNGGAQHNNPG